MVCSMHLQRKGRVREESDPLYEPEDMEETGDEVSAIKLLRIHKLIAIQTYCGFYHWDFI